MTMDAALLRILVCPIDKRELLYFADEGLLYNPRLRRRYPIADGIAVLLPRRSEPVTHPEHLRLVARADRGDAVVTWRAEPRLGST
jgi:uncharacterized protein YbaR (Trm112 family)